ncbi:solute:sodium symporter family transporter [Lactococcus termiticola]|uniref:Sodium-coupled N-acetylneuraminate transporter n=1 Tax=Lactococcus termiticola TaxID=2169526 RepID=A0A2R5HKB6_9LACT|nr:solute:sodium symporter family transporter [Lactococcus termiticola]GBG96951.1 sodium-coupled N-acetylneuraminate transporter [Lactococcus termiticola]
MNNLWTIISFFVIVGGIWIYAYRKSKRVNIQTAEGYFMGGRSLGAVNVAGAIILTNLSTDQMVGENGQSYQAGMQVMAWEVTATIAIVALGLIFIPKYFKYGIDTVPDFLEIRYDTTIKRIMSALFIITYIALFLPVLLYSGALVFNEIFHVDKILHTSQLVAVVAICIIVGLVAILYLLMGGLALTAQSDTIYSIGFLVGGLLVPILGLVYLGHGNFIGGVEQVVYHSPVSGLLNSLGPIDSKFVPWPALFTGMLVNNLYFWCTNQMIVQKAFAAKNLEAAQKGTMILGGYKIFGALFLVFPGVIARNIFGDQFLAHPDNSYPALLIQVMPQVLTGIYGAVILGSVLSSFSGALNSLVTLFSLDFYKGMINKKATDEQVARNGKLATIVVGLICIAIAPFITYAPAGLYQFIQQFNGLYNVPLLVIILFAFWSKKATAFSAKVIIPVHIVLYVIALFAFPEFNFLYTLGILFVLEAVIMWLIPKFRPQADFHLETYNTKVDMTPWRHAKTVGIISILVVLAIYAFFSPLGIGNM